MLVGRSWRTAVRRAARASPPRTGRPPAAGTSVLAKQHRLNKSDEIRRTVRSGRKVVMPSVVIHGVVVDSSDQDTPPRFGVTVSKAVGGSVVRHRVARQIRHAIAAKIPSIPAGSRWVIRALPAAAAGNVAADVDAGLDLALHKAPRVVQ